MTIINNIEIDNTKYHENELKKVIMAFHNDIPL